MVAAFSLRVVCENGAVAKHKDFSARYPHKGGNLLNGNGEFGRKTSEILEKFSIMMQELPRLGEIPVTDQFINRIRPELTDALGVKESGLFIEQIDREKETVMHVWNRVTNLPHHLPDPEQKLKIEQLGFQILTTHLHQNN